MNIFVTSDCPIQCAAFLDDKRVVKMVLESAQMLSTVYGGPYKPTHSNHPCTVWVRESTGNAGWLYEHFLALCAEYTKRYNKVHKCESLASLFKSKIEQSQKVTPFVNCTPFKDQQVFVAYRLTLMEKWKNDKRAPTWYGKVIGS